MMQLYSELDALRRAGGQLQGDDWSRIRDALAGYPAEWLLRVELLDLVSDTMRAQLLQELRQLAASSARLAEVIALELAPDEVAA